MQILIVGEDRGLATQLSRALNATERPEGCEALALNFELAADGSVPSEIELIQPGMSLVGRDGRSWINDDPAAVVEMLNARGIDLVIDFEHASEIKAPNGDPAPAAGWAKHGTFEVRDGGAIWGRVEWTPAGRAAIASREYRYLSPVIVYEKATGRIKSLSSIGLVNKPNLFNTALNQEGTKGVPAMWKQLLALLGLTETATEAEAMNALKKIQGDLATAQNRAETPSLDKFVPRADYDATVLRATNAEQKIKDQAKAELETALNAEIDGALKAGKITPATKDYYTAMCRQDGGLEAFKKFVAAAPVIGDASNLDGKTPPDKGAALNAEEQQIAGMFGNSADDLKKYATA